MAIDLPAIDEPLLSELARKYVWWKAPDDAAQMRQRLVARVMDIGDYADVQRLARAVGDSYLKRVLRQAEPGQFSARSWAYWHYRLGLASVDEVPPPPRRRTE